MPSYQHKKLITRISNLDHAPVNEADFGAWIRARAHLSLLKDNAGLDEVIVYASGEYTFVNTVIVSDRKLSPINQSDLLGWSLNAYRPVASYVSGGGRKGVWVERGLRSTGTKTLEGATQLIFGRTFEGWTGADRNYFEVCQEYTHLAGIHWRPEERAYCRYDQHGDIECVVSLSYREDERNNVSLVSFKWEPLEEYLAASNAALIQMFDFTLFRRDKFISWSRKPEEIVNDNPLLFYRQKVDDGLGAYTRGVQIIRPRQPRSVVVSRITDGWMGQKNREYAAFIAYDWRNQRVASISTDPSATTNYFEADDNELPFELSPAFFKPEVLLKYKADRDKYTVGEREVSCRAAWHLTGIDVNDAGQVHVYICYLRNLPYSEQLHWLSFNEPPKTGISERAVTTDFRGEFTTIVSPLSRIVRVLMRWREGQVSWWKLRDERLLERVHTPLTTSRDEWAEAFMDLAKLVIEGFETKAIRSKLDSRGLSYEKTDGTILLLERLLNEDKKSGGLEKFDGLRTVQKLRSKAKGHASAESGDLLAKEARMNHESFANHFNTVCEKVVSELDHIQSMFESKL